MTERLKFLNAYLRHPRLVGAIVPCSRECTAMAVHTANLEHADVVVEFGTGTGVFTKEIMKSIGSDTLFFGFEIDKKLAMETQKRCPGALIYQDSAANIGKRLKEHGKKHCDCVISTLPWTTFPQELKDEILDATYKALKPGGEFLTIAYTFARASRPGVKFKKLLEDRFSSVKKTKVVWKNLPPAIFYHCRK